MAEKSSQRIHNEYQDAKPDAPQSYDILMLSGGGALGSFGAGFLQGWETVPQGEYALPKFDTVSGISTGSLIAPFAFLGTPEAHQKIVEIYQNPGPDWVRKRGWIPFLPGNVSLLNVDGLHDAIRSDITPQMARRITAEGHAGRQLLVGATNVDYGLSRVWDLAQVSEDSTPEVVEGHIESALLASSAIPGVFPPVMIDELLYVDGGAAMQIVGGIDKRDWVFKPDDGGLKFVNDNQPIRIRVWIIVNSKLLPDPEVTQPGWASIASRSVSTLLKASTLQTIHDAELFVRLINQRPDFDAELRYVAIPQDYEIPESDDIFDPLVMRQLVELGRQLGASPGSWRVQSLRPGAPFDLD